MMQVNGERIMARIARLAQFTEADRPYTRRAFTDLYLQARDWLRGEFETPGLTPRLDEGANLFGERAGRESGLGAQLLGSHIDPLAGGGRFDGIAGVVTAVEVAQVQHENAVRLRHGLALVEC